MIFLKNKKTIFITIGILGFACLFFAGIKYSAKENNDADKKSFFGKINDALFKKEVPTTLTPINYVSFCESESSPLYSVKEMNQFNFQAFYKPIDYLVLKETKTLSSLSPKDFDLKKQEFGEMEYFSLKISVKDGKEELLKYNVQDANEYYSRVEYFSFKMQNDIKLIRNSDTIDCVLYHYERTYDLAPHATFIVGFPKIDNQTLDNLKLMIDDKIFNNGKILLGFNTTDINHLPTLNFN